MSNNTNFLSVLLDDLLHSTSDEVESTDAARLDDLAGSVFCAVMVQSEAVPVSSLL